MALLLAACAALLVTPASASSAAPAPASAALKAPTDFAAITDKAERSRALFAEAGKVIQSPRCVNCHPAGDRPSQGEDGHPHEPHVVRGADGFGAVALRCNTCHQDQNYAPSGVPGNPHWHLAPIGMAWQGRSLAQICAQIKDPARNGGRSFAQLEDHVTHDSLVGWAWHPGATRTPAAGTQAEFGALIKAWIESGAECPAG